MFRMTIILSFFCKAFAFGFQIRQQINISCFHDFPLIDVFSFSHLIPPSLSPYEKRGLFSPLISFHLLLVLSFHFLYLVPFFWRKCSIIPCKKFCESIFWFLFFFSACRDPFSLCPKPFQASLTSHVENQSN